MHLSQTLDRLYRKDAAASASLEKTAEARLADALTHEAQAVEIEESPDYSNMSLSDLMALASSLVEADTEVSAEGVDSAEVVEETPAEDQTKTASEVLEKAAADTLGGQIMAHAMVHEFSQIKIAMAQGLCRLCKTNPMDIQGHSICSSCSAE
jgi:CRP-like cAMP-binding protein